MSNQEDQSRDRMISSLVQYLAFSNRKKENKDSFTQGFARPLQPGGGAFSKQRLSRGEGGGDNLRYSTNTERDYGVISQFYNNAQQLKVGNSGGPLDSQTWQTE